MDHLPTTEAAVTVLRALAAEYALEIEVTHDIGADQTSRRTAAGVGVTADPDGSLPHEAHVELGGRPSVSVRLYPDGDALITVDGVECPDIDRDDVPAFLRALYDGHALPDAIVAATQKWMGWKIGQRNSRDYGIPSHLPYLTGFVIHCEIVEEELVA